MIIESLREYIKTCPHLDEFSSLVNVNYLSSETATYSIEEVPSEPIIKKYVNGDSIRQYDFIFSSRESYGQDVFQNIENSGFYEKFSDWIENQSLNNELPCLDGNRQALSITVTTNGYAFQTDVDRAIYQIALKLKYFQGGK